MPAAACLGALLALAATDLPAQPTIASPPAIYSCSDADGRVISSDRPIAACAHRPMRELNPDGSLRRLIAPPLTKQQEREQAALDKRRQDEIRARKVQQSRDRNLLLTFEDERSLESMRRRGLDEIDHEIRLATQRILSLDKDLKAAQDTAARYREDNPRKQLPFSFQQRITEAANAILAEDALIADRHGERDRVNSRFDADARRLRELLGTPEASGGSSRSPRG